MKIILKFTILIPEPPTEIPIVVDMILNSDVQPLEREYILFYEVNK